MDSDEVDDFDQLLTNGTLGAPVVKAIQRLTPESERRRMQQLRKAAQDNERSVSVLISGTQTDRLLEAARRLTTTPGPDVVIPRADAGTWLTTLVQHAEQLPFGSPIVGLELGAEVAARVLTPKEQRQEKQTPTDYISQWICRDGDYYSEARSRAMSLARYLIDVLEHARRDTPAWWTRQQLSPMQLAQVDWLSVAADLVGDPPDWESAAESTQLPGRTDGSDD